MSLPKTEKGFGQGGLAAIHTQTTFAFSRCKILELLSANNTNSCPLTPWHVWPISYSGVTVDVSVMSLKYQSPSPLECSTPLHSMFVCLLLCALGCIVNMCPNGMLNPLYTGKHCITACRVSKQDRTLGLCWICIVHTEALGKLIEIKFHENR